MRLVVLHRPQATSGGDWIALNGYANAMRRTGIDIELRNATEPGDLSEADYVQLWAACSPDWGLPAAMEVKRQDKPLIITPFWWSREERQSFYGKAGQDLVPGYTQAVAATLRLADILFVVTMSEAVECWKLAPKAQVWKVPMGFDRPPITKRHKPEDYVLCIGRIEPHKNQLMLARACQQLGYPLQLIGDANMDTAYFNNIIAAGAIWHQGMNDEDKYSMLSKARCHALPSFFENPGLAHGEAMQMGIATVMGGHGCEPEFFGPAGIYCNPTDLDSIIWAVDKAWNTQRIIWPILPTWNEVVEIALEWMCE